MCTYDIVCLYILSCRLDVVTIQLLGQDRRSTLVTSREAGAPTSTGKCMMTQLGRCAQWVGYCVILLRLRFVRSLCVIVLLYKYIVDGERGQSHAAEISHAEKAMK